MAHAVDPADQVPDDHDTHALARAIGTDDPATVSGVWHAGIRPSNVALLEWLPAVDLAWLNGLTALERHALLDQFAAYGPATRESTALLERWLTTRPEAHQFLAGRSALKARLRQLDVRTRRAVASSVVSRCETTGYMAVGSGGMASSTAERAHVDALLRELGDVD